jgi:hypothetical protein
MTWCSGPLGMPEFGFGMPNLLGWNTGGSFNNGHLNSAGARFLNAGDYYGAGIAADKFDLAALAVDETLRPHRERLAAAQDGASGATATQAPDFLGSLLPWLMTGANPLMTEQQAAEEATDETTAEQEAAAAPTSAELAARDLAIVRAERLPIYGPAYGGYPPAYGGHPAYSGYGAGYPPYGGGFADPWMMGGYGDSNDSLSSSG